MTKALILAVISVMLAHSVIAQSNQNRKIPPLSLKDLKGKTVSLQGFKGKVVLLNFWATWCPPCLAEIPELVKWQKQYQNQGLQIVGVTYPPTNLLKVRSFVRRNKINYPVLLGSKKTKSIFDSGQTMPLSVVIDRDGSIRDVIEGILYPDEFAEKIQPLLIAR